MNPNRTQPALPCPHCGYDLRGIAEASQAAVVVCSECGGRVRVDQPSRLRAGGYTSRDWWYYVLGPSPPVLTLVLELIIAWIDPASKREEVETYFIVMTPVLILILAWCTSWREPTRSSRILMTVIHDAILCFINLVLFSLIYMLRPWPFA